VAYQGFGVLFKELAERQTGQRSFANARLSLAMVHDLPGFGPNPLVGKVFSEISPESLPSPEVRAVNRLESKWNVRIKHGLPNRLGQTKLEGIETTTSLL
jgi:hypothetical protein